MELSFYSIGVYGSTEDEFFQKLLDNKIDTFLDIRQRRGVRGSKYAYVNSKRLQSKLNALNIRYQHVIELAPTKEIRELQKQADEADGIKKRERTELGSIFKIAYKEKVLSKFDLPDLIDSLRSQEARRVVLFCVEEAANACHRSLVTAKLRKNYGYPITHL